MSTLNITHERSPSPESGLTMSLEELFELVVSLQVQIEAQRNNFDARLQRNNINKRLEMQQNYVKAMLEVHKTYIDARLESQQNYFNRRLVVSL